MHAARGPRPVHGPTDRRLNVSRTARPLSGKLRAHQTPDAPTDPALVAIAIRDLAPEPDWPYWLLAIAAAQNRTIGIIEGCLDHADCPHEARDHLTALLAGAVERGAGAELTQRRFEQLAHRAFKRPIDIDELVAPACFVVDSALTLPDPSTQELILGSV